MCVGAFCDGATHRRCRRRRSCDCAWGAIRMSLSLLLWLGGCWWFALVAASSKVIVLPKNPSKLSKYVPEGEKPNMVTDALDKVPSRALWRSGDRGSGGGGGGACRERRARNRWLTSSRAAQGDRFAVVDGNFVRVHWSENIRYFWVSKFEKLMRTSKRMFVVIFASNHCRHCPRAVEGARGRARCFSRSRTRRSARQPPRRSLRTSGRENEGLRGFRRRRLFRATGHHRGGVADGRTAAAASFSFIQQSISLSLFLWRRSSS